VCFQDVPNLSTPAAELQISGSCDKYAGHIGRTSGNRICRVGERDAAVTDTYKAKGLARRTAERAGAGSSAGYATLDAAIFIRRESRWRGCGGRAKLFVGGLRVLAAFVEASEHEVLVGAKHIIDIAVSKPCLVKTDLKSPRISDGRCWGLLKMRTSQYRRAENSKIGKELVDLHCVCEFEV